MRSGRKGFVGLFLSQALRGETVRVFGDGSQRRDFNYVDDVVDALLLAGEDDALSGGAFNLGHPRPCSLLQFVEILQRLASFDYELVPFPAEALAIDIGDYYGEFAKFSGATGWAPRIDLAEGLERTLAYFRGRT